MLQIYNSLTRNSEPVKPLHPPHIGIYTCGPTVYDHATIGNWRTYTMSDILVRTLKASGYDVQYIMNLTDVGHLTGDNLGDADTGEDRLEKAAKKERKTAWDIAKMYTEEFLKAYDELNLTRPELFTKATEHIQEQIKLIKLLEKNGYTYQITDGIYFNVSKYESDGNTYGVLSNLDSIKEGARVEKNPEKKDPRDFALWKFSPDHGKRDMEWDSPWGKGFPGWHIECSAMSMKYLGEQFDIHVGGEDLKSTHHPNEIAQAEGATRKHPFVKYWVHGAFLLVDGGRMGKSLGNAYTLRDIKEKGFDPLDLRYFYLTAQYRTQQNFTWEALEAAKTARERLNNIVVQLRPEADQPLADVKEYRRTALSPEKLDKTKIFQEKFAQAVQNDLNMPGALAIVWESVKSNIPSEDKYDLLISFDEILGLKLNMQQEINTKQPVPAEITALAHQREQLRKEKKFDEADAVRKQIEEKGYTVEDTTAGQKIKTV